MHRQIVYSQCIAKLHETFLRVSEQLLVIYSNIKTVCTRTLWKQRRIFLAISFQILLQHEIHIEIHRFPEHLPKFAVSNREYSDACRNFVYPSFPLIVSWMFHATRPIIIRILLLIIYIISLFVRLIEALENFNKFR